MSQPVRILLSLVAGLVIGILFGRAGGETARIGIVAAELIGTTWLSGLQMTVVPLVVSLLVTGVASTAEAASSGRLAGRTIGLALVLLAVNAGIATLVTPLILDTVPIPAEAAQALRGALGGLAEQVPAAPSIVEFFKTIVPTNVVAAASSGALLSLIVFTLAFAFALTRIDSDARGQVVGLFAGVRDAMLVVVGWILWLAPVGVFSLAFLLGARAGGAAFGALVHYMAVISAVGLVVVAVAYGVAAVGARVPIGRFARAAVPAQAFAISTQSSLATLPAMLKAAGEMGVPRTASGLTLPLGVATFRATQPAMNIAIAIYIARWFGVEVPIAAVAAGAVVGVLISLGSISLPSQLTFFPSVTPIASTMGVPLAPLGLLIAVETIPDIFRTLGNVTSNLALTAIVTRDQPADADAPAPIEETLP